MTTAAVVLAALVCAAFAAASALLLLAGDTADRGAALAGLLLFGPGAVVLTAGLLPPGWSLPLRRLPLRRLFPRRARRRPARPAGTLVLPAERPGLLAPAAAIPMGASFALIAASAGGVLARAAGIAGAVFFTGGGLWALAAHLRAARTAVDLSPTALTHRRPRRRTVLPWAHVTEITLSPAGTLDVTGADGAVTRLPLTAVGLPVWPVLDAITLYAAAYAPGVRARHPADLGWDDDWDEDPDDDEDDDEDPGEGGGGQRRRQ